VQQRIADALDAAPAGTVRAISACAGQGRDILGVLAEHRRAGDVRARLVELDGRNVAAARAAIDAIGLGEHVQAVQGDAGNTSVFEGAVPADLVLFCGIFGNVPDRDVERTVRLLPMMCAPGATVLWTRHRERPDLTPTIREWFAASGFEEVAFDAPESMWISVGTNRFVGPAAPYQAGVELFAFEDAGP
jgi:putative methyltransferase